MESGTKNKSAVLSGHDLRVKTKNIPLTPEQIRNDSSKICSRVSFFGGTTYRCSPWHAPYYHIKPVTCARIHVLEA